MRRKDKEITKVEEIIKILDSCKVCHLAMCNKDIPYIVPLSFGYEMIDDTLVIYFHSAKEGKKLDDLHKNNKVCFEICNEGEVIKKEIPCDSGVEYASVIGLGEVMFIEDVSEKCHGLSVLFKQQTNAEVEFSEEQVKDVCVFKVTSKEFTGKKK